MSVAVPVAAIAFGSVTPPQGDILELRVHLGCTKEVSSFDCLLQNFDKKYTATNPINVGDNCSISIGRGANCPLILTGRVEEIQPESTPVENYIRVRGRCWGEKIFRRVVTKTYENQKGEAIVKDLLDNYVGLSHSRTSDLTQDAAAGQPECVVADGTKFRAGDKVQISDDDNSEWNEVSSVSANTVTMVNNLAYTYTVSANGKVTSELVEATDTTYTLLEYENTPVFDILKYIAESADKAGVIGYDFRIEYDSKFRFFPKTTKTSPISLSEVIEASRYSKDIHRIRNKITVYGAAEKANPGDKDAWTETLDINNDTTDDWSSGTGTGSVSLDGTEKILGSYSIKHTTSTPDYYGCAILTFPSGMEVDCNKYPSLTFQIKLESAFNGNIGLELEDSAGMKVRREIGVSANNKWVLQGFGVGKKHTDEWTHSLFNSQPFNWGNVKKILWYCNFSGTGTGSFRIDNLFFNRRRWEATQENSSSQSSYGLRELVEVDEELHSDNECDLRAKALLDHLSDPAEFLTLRSDVIDYGTNRLLPADKIHVTLPNENINSDFRVISVEYRVIAREQALEITLELGKEKPLLADYLYGLRSTTVTVEKLMRTKAGRSGVAGSAGGGGGGGAGTDEKVKVTSNDTVAEYLKEKLTAGTGITLTEQNDGGDESLKIDAHRKWSWADEQGYQRTIKLPLTDQDGWKKYSGNPVFQESGVSGAFDEYSVITPCVLKVGNYYYMAYTGAGGAYPYLSGYYREVGVARFSDPTETYTRMNNGQAIIPRGGAGSWREKSIDHIGWIYDDYETDVNKKWKAWVRARNASDVVKCGYFYAPDPPTDPTAAWTWTEYSGNPLSVPNFNNAPSVFRLGNLFYMAYRDTSNKIRCAVSHDGITWTDMGVIIDLGAAGQWDDGNLANPCLFWNLGVWMVFYIGTRTPPPWKIGMALASNEPFAGGYNKWGRNPVVESGTGWEASLTTCSLLMIEDRFKMWYAGEEKLNGYYRYRIGLATIP